MDKTISAEFSRLVAYVVNSFEPGNEEEEAIKQYIRLILKIAKKYVREGVDYEDLISWGLIGLIEAVRNFDITRSTNFQNYAITRMRGRMYEYAIANSTVITVPTHVSKARVHIEKMTNVLNREPLLFQLGVKSEDIISIWKHPIEKDMSDKPRERLRHIKSMVSRIAANSKTTYQELIRLAYLSMVTMISEDKLQSGISWAGNERIETEVLASQVKKILENQLGKKKTRVIEAHHQGCSNEDIADILHEEKHTSRRISRQAVRGLLIGAEKKAKKHVK
ncbi:MAG TPA: sigma-70 family RNA polymerase sigma factor [bacterium]|nr:sigma-70 family RNA polymerase sigma factor [bacterium]